MIRSFANTGRRQSGPTSLHQRGQIAIEYVIIIALVALALIGVIYFFTKGRNTNSVNNQASILTNIVADTQKLFQSQPDYSTLTGAVLINNNAIPSTMVSGTNIVSGWNTPVTVAPGNLYGTNDAAIFTYTVPQNVCSDFTSAVASSFPKITIAGTAVKDMTAGTALSVAALGTACAAAPAAGAAIAFYAGK